MLILQEVIKKGLIIDIWNVIKRELYKKNIFDICKTVKNGEILQCNTEFNPIFNSEK